jgi:plastocyanin
MEQRVTVLKKKAKGADRDPKVRARVLKQSAALYKAAGKAAKVTPAANTVHVGEQSKQATLLTYLPNTITVQRGTTVAFVNSAPSEPHNVVFGPAEPGGYVEKFTQETDLLPLGPGAPNQVSPAYVFGSEPPASDGTWTYTGKNYGNGFFWSPLMDDQEGDPPAGLPGTENIRFDTPGTYKYFCAIHGPDMNGTVVVQ